MESEPLALTRTKLNGILAESGITVDVARDMLMQSDNLDLLHAYYTSYGDEDPMTDASEVVDQIQHIATELHDLPNDSSGNELRMLFYTAFSDLVTQTALRPPLVPSTSPVVSHRPLTPMGNLPIGTSSPMVNPPIGTLTPTTDQVPGQPTTNTSINLPSMTIPSSEQDLERYVQLSMKYGPQRAKDILKTYSYNRQTTEPTVDRGRHDYTPMSIARYTDFLPERD